MQNRKHNLTIIAQHRFKHLKGCSLFFEIKSRIEGALVVDYGDKKEKLVETMVTDTQKYSQHLEKSLK